MNRPDEVARILLLSALFFIALLLMKQAPLIFVPIFLLYPLLRFRRGERLHFQEEDPADWWKKETRD